MIRQIKSTMTDIVNEYNGNPDFVRMVLNGEIKFPPLKEYMEEKADHLKDKIQAILESFLTEDLDKDVLSSVVNLRPEYASCASFAFYSLMWMMDKDPENASTYFEFSCKNSRSQSDIWGKATIAQLAYFKYEDKLNNFSEQAVSLALNPKNVRRECDRFEKLVEICRHTLKRGPSLSMNSPNDPNIYRQFARHILDEEGRVAELIKISLESIKPLFYTENSMIQLELERLSNIKVTNLMELDLVFDLMRQTRDTLLSDIELFKKLAPTSKSFKAFRCFSPVIFSIKPSEIDKIYEDSSIIECMEKIREAIRNGSPEKMVRKHLRLFQDDQTWSKLFPSVVTRPQNEETSQTKESKELFSNLISAVVSEYPKSQIPEVNKTSRFWIKLIVMDAVDIQKNARTLLSILPKGYSSCLIDLISTFAVLNTSLHNTKLYNDKEALRTAKAITDPNNSDNEEAEEKTTLSTNAQPDAHDETISALGIFQPRGGRSSLPIDVESTDNSKGNDNTIGK